jgi:thiol-disulfide isomerase/thioredoxin
MRLVAFAACLLVAAPWGVGCLGAGGVDGLVGKPVPAFTLVTSEGQHVNQSTWLGHHVVLDLMATWCAPCRVEVGHLQVVRQAYGEQVMILSIDVDPTESSAELDQFAKDHNATWPHAFDFDGAVGRSLGLGIPTLLIVDPQGRVVFQHQGEVKPDEIAAVVGPVRAA